MSPTSWMERETNRARALADALADVRVKLSELEAVQRGMMSQGVEPRHVIRAESVEYLEGWFAYHARRVDWRLRHPGQSHHHAQVVTAKNRARRIHEIGL